MYDIDEANTLADYFLSLKKYIFSRQEIKATQQKNKLITDLIENANE